MACNFHPEIKPACTANIKPSPYTLPHYTLNEPNCTAHLEMVNYTSTCTVTCKFCGSKNVVKNGVRRGNIQYYLCRDCKRTFAGNNALEYMKYPPERIASAISLFYEGLSIDAIRRELDNQFNVYPSDSTVYEWITRFTKVAIDKAVITNISVGDVWVGDETVLDIGGENVWFWDIIDTKTRFLLASSMSLTRTKVVAEGLMLKAKERAGKAPKTVITDKLAAYIDGIELAFGSETKHKQGNPFASEYSSKASSNAIERFHGTLKARTKVMRGMKNRDTAKVIMDGWLIYYNFFRPHEGLKNKTPAEVAKAKFPYKNWLDVVMANAIRSEGCLSD